MPSPHANGRDPVLLLARQQRLLWRHRTLEAQVDALHARMRGLAARVLRDGMDDTDVVALDDCRLALGHAVHRLDQDVAERRDLQRLTSEQR